MKKGIDKERDLVNYLDFKGFRAVRVAGSGGGTKKDRCDILAGNGNKIYAIELKSSSKDRIYINKAQIRELYRFSRGFGAIPVIAVKFTYEPYKFIDFNDFIYTKRGNYCIKREMVENLKNRFILKG